MEDNSIIISKSVVEAQKLVLPEIIALIDLRDKLLTTISIEQPIGRRNLAFILNLSERHVRNEIDFLSQQKLVSVERQGIVLTSLGEALMDKLGKIKYLYNGNEELERKLEQKLGLKKGFVSPGNLEKNRSILQLMGQACARYILSVIKPMDVMALSGGSGTAAVAAQMPRSNFPDIYIIPTRGGIGKGHEVQANNVVAQMGEKLGCNYDLLHLPNNIESELLDALKSDNEIKRVFDKMNEIDIFVFGIGRAEERIKFRNYDDEIRKNILDKGAVGESFGHFVDLNGNIVSSSGSISVSLENYSRIKETIAIAGGESKADAIIGVSRIKKNLVLITDESAAKCILRKL